MDLAWRMVDDSFSAVQKPCMPSWTFLQWRTGQIHRTNVQCLFSPVYNKSLQNTRYYCTLHMSLIKVQCSLLLSLNCLTVEIILYLMPTTEQRQAANTRRCELRHLREDALRNQQDTSTLASETHIALRRRGRPPRQLSSEERKTIRTTHQRECRQCQRNSISTSQGSIASIDTVPHQQPRQQTPSEPLNDITLEDSNIPTSQPRRMGRKPRNISSEERQTQRNACRRELRQLQRNNNTHIEGTISGAVLTSGTHVEQDSGLGAKQNLNPSSNVCLT